MTAYTGFLNSTIILEYYLWKYTKIEENCFFLPLSVETSRESDWDGIAACHQGTSMVTTWNYQKSNMGKHKIKHDRFKGIPGVQATVRALGHF